MLISNCRRSAQGVIRRWNQKWTIVIALWIIYLVLFWVAFAKFNGNLSAYNSEGSAVAEKDISCDLQFIALKKSALMP